jgi:hypothetical protein
VISIKRQLISSPFAVLHLLPLLQRNITQCTAWNQQSTPQQAASATGSYAACSAVQVYDLT